MLWSCQAYCHMLNTIEYFGKCWQSPRAINEKQPHERF